ncbi:MAG: alpha amylase C-terminal domain-containing protein, partial [Eubacterium sp.]
YCRNQFHSKLTFSMAYAFSENFILPLSHDEVVHGKHSIVDKMFGPYEMKFSQLRLLYAYMYFHSGKKLTFMGNEFAPFTEWRYYESLEWFMLENEPHNQTWEFMKDLNKFYVREKALWERDHGWEGFEWIDADNSSQSILVFRRMGKHTNDDLVILINFCPLSYTNYKIGVPTDRTYRLVFNSDEGKYGGSDFAIKKTAKAQNSPYHNQPYSVTVNIPPYSALFLNGFIQKAKNKSAPKKKKTAETKKTTVKK